MNDLGKRIAAKVQVRFVWPLLLLLFLNSLDRVNVSFGALQMNHEIGLTPKTYGAGVGVFFIGYILAQIPSTMLLKRFGARVWLFGVVVFWGAVATGMAFVHDAAGFYVLRVLLGFAEAGFAPGIVYLASQWMPARYRAGAIATTMLAIPISIIVGGPLSGWLMTMHNPMGLAGWRWMFLAEGLPTVVLAFLCLVYFVDAPAQAAWLSAEEKAWLAGALAAEDAAETAKRRAWWKLFFSPRTWLAALAWFSLMAGAYGVIFWLPQVVKQMSGGSALDVGLITALPWIGVALGMALNAWHSDRTQERHLHVAGAALLGAAGLVGAAALHDSRLALLCLIIGGIGLGGAQGTFWTIPPTFLGRAAALGGITLINMAGNISGVVGPVMIGAIRESTGSFTTPVYALAAIIAAGAVLTLVLRAFTPSRTATPS